MRTATRPGAERFYSEKLVRLAGGSQCWRPPDDAPDVGPLPAERKGHVMFGCLNKGVKVTPEVARLWARILERAPSSRLMVLGPQAADAGEATSPDEAAV